MGGRYRTALERLDPEWAQPEPRSFEPRWAPRIERWRGRHGTCVPRPLMPLAGPTLAARPRGSRGRTSLARRWCSGIRAGRTMDDVKRITRLAVRLRSLRPLV